MGRSSGGRESVETLEEVPGSGERIAVGPPSRPMTVLHFVAPAGVGGLESVVRTLCGGHRRAGHEVHVLAVAEPEDELDDLLRDLRRDDVRVHLLRLPPRSYPEERRQLIRHADRLAPDVVHAHGYRPVVIAASAAGSLAAPLVTTLHGFTGGGLKNRVYQWLERVALRRYDGVVAVSRSLAEEVSGRWVPEERVHVLNNAWDGSAPDPDREAARGELSIPADGFVAGWVGRLSPEKGPDLMLEALARAGPLPIRVSMVGEGPADERLRRRASGLGIGERIRWHGTVPRAARLFRAFDVFVLSSRTEGVPIVLFEAMAAGVPIIATRVGGVSEILDPSCALLVPPDVERLAGALREVFVDPDAADRRARAARERLEAFRPGPWLEAYEDIYRRVAVR